jgi:serine/threonine-protein kinase RsbT
MQSPVERILIVTSEDLVALRRTVRERAAALGFGHTDQVRLVTAASELGRNILLYGERGYADLSTINRQDRRGIRVCFVDEGQGIDDIDLALRDGYTSGRGLGKGLPGARRLVDEFAITSEIGRGTVVTITKWL